MCVLSRDRMFGSLSKLRGGTDQLMPPEVVRDRVGLLRGFSLLLGADLNFSPLQNHVLTQRTFLGFLVCCVGMFMFAVSVVCFVCTSSQQTAFVVYIVQVPTY